MQSKNCWRHRSLTSSTTRVRSEFKEISVDTYTEKGVLRVDSRFINHDLVCTREKSLKASETVSRTSSTIQAVLPAQINFRYLQKKQIQALKTQGHTAKK